MHCTRAASDRYQPYASAIYIYIYKTVTNFGAFKYEIKIEFESAL